MAVLQQIVDGITSGSIYGALALAIVLVYRSTGFVNFAQAQMGALSAYVAWALTTVGVPVGLAVAGAIVASLALGAGTERVLIRRFAGAPPLTTVVVSIGVLIVINGFISLVWGGSVKPFPSIFPGGVLAVGDVRISAADIGTVVVLIAVVVLLQLLFVRTRLGLALRAVADNPSSSALLGLPTGALLMVGWALAAALGGLAGCLIAPEVSLTPNMLDSVLVYALAAAVLGGLDSPLGAIVAAWSIGIVESVAGANIGFVGNDLRIIVPLLAMVVVLLVRPQGLFGRREVERV